MNHKRIPDWVLAHFSEVTPEWLAERGLRGVLTDLDNTLAPYGQPEPGKEVIMWIESLKKSGVQVAVISNNHNPERVSLFCGNLGISFKAKSKKPSPVGLLACAEEFGLVPNQMLMLGDQIFTDVQAGKNAGMYTAIVRPLSRNIFFMARRCLEMPYIKCSIRRNNTL